MATHRKGRSLTRHPLVSVSHNRLREACEAAGLDSAARVVAALPAGMRVARSQVDHLLSGRRKRARADFVAALARLLGVSPDWLCGKDAYPIRFRGFELSLKNLSGEVRGSSLRHARLIARCLKASRGDYELIEKKKATGDEWRAIEWELFQRFWLMLDSFPDADRYFVGPADGVLKPAESPEIGRERFERAAVAAAEYWESVLDPWFQGKVGFDPRRLPVPGTVYTSRDERVSPRVILEKGRAAPPR